MNLLARWMTWSRQLGVPGYLGVLMLAGALLAWWLVLPVQKDALAAQQDDMAHQREQLHHLAVAGQGAPVPQAFGAPQAWQALWAALPPAEESDHWRLAVLEAARTQGLNIDAVQYQGAALKGMPQIWREQVSVPIRAPYPAVRAWLGQLSTYPMLSIDALELQRPDPAVDEVKGQVRLSLWWRQRSSGAQP